MTPDERQLIEGLFKRMESVPMDGKDRDAEALIQQAIRANPHAPYVMVQALLIGEGALEGAQKRIQELEHQLAQAQRQTQPSGGGFLGGLFGSRSAPPAPQPTGFAPQGSPWGAPPQQPGYGQPGGFGGQQGYGQPGPWGGQPQQPSFMRQALMTAAGVAGGVVVGSALMSMFSSSSAAAATGMATDAVAGASDAATGALGGAVADSGWGDSAPAAQDHGQGGGWESADAGGFDGGESGDSGDW